MNVILVVLHASVLAVNNHVYFLQAEPGQLTDNHGKLVNDVFVIMALSHYITNITMIRT